MLTLRPGLHGLIFAVLLIGGCAPTTNVAELNEQTMTIHPPKEDSFLSERRLAASKAGKATLTVGSPKVVELSSPDELYKVVFEDDGQTGYFYALLLGKADFGQADPAQAENPIVDAMQIYNVNEVTDRNDPSQLHILWSPDGQSAGLWINSYVHAIYNFDKKSGCCRTGLGRTSTEGRTHTWDEAAIEPFISRK